MTSQPAPLHPSKKATETPGCEGCRYSVRLTRGYDDFGCDHPDSAWSPRPGHRIYTSQSLFFSGTCKGALKELTNVE